MFSTVEYIYMNSYPGDKDVPRQGMKISEKWSLSGNNLGNWKKKYEKKALKYKNTHEFSFGLTVGPFWVYSG